MLDLLDKDFTPAITNTLEELKETMYKEMKVCQMSHQININKETKIIKENQIEIMELKYIKLKWKIH